MTPQEKAAELVKKFEEYAVYDDDNPRIVIFAAKQCALIGVEEIINNNSKIPGLLTQDTMHNTWYWQEVKQEIEKL
jgi:hypothetical protein